MKRVIKNVRLAFPDLWEATEFTPADGRPRFNATFLIEPGSDADKAIRADILARAKEAWDTDAAKKLKQLENNPNKYCYTNGDLKDYDGYKGMMVLSSHRREKDGAPDIRGNWAGPDGKPVKLTQGSGKPYAGCYVNATVEIFVQAKGEYTGVRCTLVGVQYWKDGDSFGGVAARSSDDDFEVLEEGASADDLVG